MQDTTNIQQYSSVRPAQMIVSFSGSELLFQSYLGINLLEAQVLLLHLLQAALQLSLQLVLLSQDTFDFLCSICTSSKGGSFQSLKNIRIFRVNITYRIPFSQDYFLLTTLDHI